MTPIITDLQPGAYVEAGGRVDLLKSLASWMVLGVNFAASVRDYRNDIVTTSLEKRQDLIVSPGVVADLSKSVRLSRLIFVSTTAI